MYEENPEPLFASSQLVYLLVNQYTYMNDMIVPELLHIIHRTNAATKLALKIAPKMDVVCLLSFERHLLIV